MAASWFLYCFIALFSFRYLRLVLSIFAYFCYKPSPVPNKPHYLPSDVTVVIASIDCQGGAFVATIKSALYAGVAKVVVVTISDNLKQAHETFEIFGEKICLLSCKYANKRTQLCRGLKEVETDIVMLMDDHVWFERPDRFLSSVLAPFEDLSVGGVSVGKQVERVSRLPLFSWPDILNALGCCYLARHNFELAASNTIDGGVFVISGRTAAYRSSIICDISFMEHFCNEYWFFGIGPLHADDDNCITRYLVSNDWKIKFQYSDDATVWTVLGVEGFNKFRKQCIRWSRTTWRSNSTSVFADRTVWRSQPWCMYAVYFSSFVNFALFTDAALLVLCKQASPAFALDIYRLYVLLVPWIIGSKTVKLLPHFYRCPRDVLYLPVFIAFGYFHSFIKLWSLLTVNSLTWGSRPNVVP